MRIVLDASKVSLDQVTINGNGTPPPPADDLTKELEGPNPPMILLDKVQITKEELNQVKSDQIESVVILKGKSATELYGEKGKNGVVLIATKAKVRIGTGNPIPPPSPASIHGIDEANPPLIFLDGIPISKFAMDKLNPETIESMNVLKDKSAVEKYGEKGKNGVILITSKGNAKLKLIVLDGVPTDPSNFNMSGLKNYVTVNLLNGDTATKLFGEKGKNGAFMLISKDKYIESQLILLDGKAISKSEMDQLGPDKIESINILNGKSATDKYGDKAKNGVILIKSKAYAGNNSDSNVNPVSDKKQDTVRFDKNNPPLYFVDNVLIDPNDIDQTKPDRIDHIDVLREKRASQLYGEKGKNGAVFIYTKAKSDNSGSLPLSNLSDKAGSQKDEPVFNVVEQMPEFPGGEKALKDFIGSSIKYPVEAIKKNIQGKVFVTFVVTHEGAVTKARVVRSVDPLLDQEALRVINLLPTWKPGKQRGVEVDVAYTIPVQFALDGDKNAKVSLIPSTNVPKQRPDGVFVVVEEMPEFPGGEIALRDFIVHNIKYPAAALKDSIQGKVFVTFVVKADGTVGDAMLARGIHPLLDNEAIRVVNSLPAWKPGKVKGVAVPVSYTVPVKFALDGHKAGYKTVPDRAVDPQNQVDGNKAGFKTVSDQAAAPQKQADGVFVVVEEMPEFVGGQDELIKFLVKEIKYPENAKKNKTTGKVFVSFVVSSNGKVEQAKIVKAVDPELDAEALRVINLMPPWKPGTQHGKAVSVAYTMPIMFALQ